MKVLTLIVCICLSFCASGCSNSSETTDNMSEQMKYIKEHAPAPVDATRFGPRTYKQAVPLQDSRTSTTTDIFAYLTFRSRIYSYKLANGVLTPVKNGEVNVGYVVNRVVVDASARYAYITDTKSKITRFKIDSNGALVDPWYFQLEPGININECVIGFSGKNLYVAVNGCSEDRRSGGQVAQFSIQLDGTLVPMAPFVVDTGCSTNRLYAHPAGKYLYAGHHGGKGGIRGLTISSDGLLSPMPVEETDGISQLCTEMAMTSDGSDLFVGDDKDRCLKWAAISVDGSATLITKSVIPEGVDIGGVMSVAVDFHGNVMIVTPSRWLSTYKMTNNILRPNGSFACLQNGIFLTDTDMAKYAINTEMYAKVYQRLANKSKEEQESRPMQSSLHEYCSALYAVRVAPDGYLYVFATSGVYRFKSTPDGIVYSGPAISWVDSLPVIYNPPMDLDLSGTVEPVMGGLTFAERK